ncbi:helix-turn-helix domain-containing protein [Kineosporia sp. A_224]|uniref:helix-turn-helix domain-containing protein n=1 Tax=Kineosporia sp. A_224 TaxID=1962180 RepID=UPI000B4C0D5D|nr:helix-turn-helix domain-containing protein [Kineosporia sp. A_224]
MIEQLAARLLKEARTRAGLSQVELARRAGVTQSVISAYESGKRQPALPTLMDLVRASGMDLVVQVEPVPAHRGPLGGPLGRRVEEHREALKAAAAQHGITNLRVFGSVARGDEGPSSDVDLLADFADDVGLFAVGRARAALEGLLGAEVDLVPERALKDDVRETITPELIAL